jgi:protocatechuate 3,4-dioxygenase beta subunit
MQRGLIIGAVIATLGALLYLQLGPEVPSTQTASGGSRGTSSDNARQWLPWNPQPSPEDPSHASGEQAGSSSEQASSAGEKDEADLPGTFSLRGYVTDEHGQPLEKVSVRARPSANSVAQTRDEVETDAQGRFRLRSLVPGFYDLRFKRERFLTRSLETWQLIAHPDLLTVQLRPAPSIQGRVVDTAGKPLHDVEVKLYKLDRELAQLNPSVAEEQVVADVSRLYANSTQTAPDGTFILDTDEPGGDWLVLAQREGFTPVEQKVTSPARDVRLVLGAGASVEVTVVDGQDQPVPHANVALWHEEAVEELTAELTTDEAGRGVLQGLGPGQYGLVATPPEGEGFRMVAASLALHGEETQQVRLRFDEGLSLSGVVVNRAGAPIPDVEVRAQFLPRRGPPERSPLTIQSFARRGVDLQDVESVRHILYLLGRGRHTVPHRVRTGPDGRFTVPHLMPFVHRLSFEKSGYALVLPPGNTEDEVQPDWLEASPGQDGLRVLLTYQGRVSGRVVRAVDGEPIASFQLDGQSHTSPDGTFTMTAGEPGPHTIDILVPGVGGLHVRYETREGEDVDLGDLVVGDGRPVRVRVEDAATALPIADVELDLREEAPSGTPARVERGGEAAERGTPLTQVELGLENTPETGRDGTCLLPDVPSRPLVLTAERKGYESVSVVLGPGEQEVTLRMRAWATVQGWVRVDGNPIAKGDVNFYTLEGRMLNDLEVRNGWYSGHLFPPGRYLVRAECDSCPDPEPVFVIQQLDVPGPQGTLSVDFQEAHGATLEVRTSPEVAQLILVPGQPPLPTQRREHRALSRSRHPRELLEGEERGYRFRDVPPGRYTLFFVYQVNDESGPVQREEIQIPAEGILRIQLPPQ